MEYLNKLEFKENIFWLILIIHSLIISIIIFGFHLLSNKKKKERGKFWLTYLGGLLGYLLAYFVSLLLAYPLGFITWYIFLTTSALFAYIFLRKSLPCKSLKDNNK